MLDLHPQSPPQDVFDVCENWDDQVAWLPLMRNGSVTLVAGPLFQGLALILSATSFPQQMTKPRLLIEIVSETPCWLFREKAVCKACAWSCVQRGLIQLLLRPPFLSCNETSVHICGQTTVESTGCMHVSWVWGVALAVYILAWVCAVFPPDWYMSFEHSPL